MKISFTKTRHPGQKSLVAASNSWQTVAFPLAKLVLLTRSMFLKKTSKSCLAVLVVWICAPCWLYGQTTWTGAISTFWGNSGNWTAGIPDANDDVIIPSMANDPVIVDAIAKSIHIQAGAELSVAFTGSLVIGGSTTHGILNQGDLLNYGSIHIGSAGSLGNYGIRNNGLFTNHGLITIVGATTYGIWNNTGTITNTKSIFITSGTRCIYNEATFNNNTEAILKVNDSSQYGIENLAGTFTNSAIIYIGSSSGVGTSGIKNNATFSNGGSISIDRCTSSGFLNSAGTFTNSQALVIGSDAEVGANGIVNSASAIINNNPGGFIFTNRSTTTGIDNGGTFNNTSYIYLNQLDPHSSNGIKNTGTFSNLGSGQISIDRLNAYGIWNNAGTFTNAATLNIGSGNAVGTRCIYNQSTFSNNTGGVINARNASIYGIEHVTGTFTNAATINIGSTSSVGTSGLRNAATFNNNAGGQINIDRSTETGLWNKAGVFANAGTITIGSLAAVGLRCFYNESTFNNNTGGVINVNNASLYGIEHITGTFTNAATINVGSTSSVGTSGLRNVATFNNNGSGQINIDQITGSGIWNNAGTFTNAAGITIGSNEASSMLYGIQNAAAFNTNGSGQIKIDRSSEAGLWNNAGTFTNAATITIGSLSSVGEHGLRNASTFNNNAGGQINIDRSNSNGLLNEEGTFTNVATMNIGALAASAMQYGIQNKVIFNNNGSGEIKIDRSSEAGLLNNAGTFTNAATLTIGSTAAIGDRCIYNNASGTFNNNIGGVINANNAALYAIEHVSGTFTNQATIHIGSLATAGTYGLRNSGTFNNTSGQIKIDRSTSFGLRNNAGTFTNAATLTIGSLASVGTTGISNSAIINNNAGGTINIDRTTIRGIINATGAFTNVATINIGNNAASSIDFGIQNTTSFNNNAGGQININRVTDSGISNTTGTFTNAATINIGSNAASSMLYGIQNTDDFTNSGTGQINVNRSTTYGVWNNVGGTFTNAAMLSIGSTAAVGTRCIYNESTFSNNTGGVINANNTSLYGIEHVSGTFTNAATINIGSLATAGTYGLRNNSTFNNNTGGMIKIDRSTSFGLRNNSGTFTNASTLTIGSLAAAGTTGISNAATINNNAGGVINIDRVTTQGINNVTGTFTNNGTVKIGEITSIAALFIGSGGTFSNGTAGTFNGTGSIDAEFFTNAGGTLSPGYSPGIHSFTANENFASSILHMEVTGSGGAAGTDFDRIAVTGTAALSNTTTFLQLVFSYAVGNGATFDLITATSVTGIIPAENISFTNTGAGNVTGVSVSYPGSNKLRVTITSPPPLPVTLVSFVAKNEGNARQLLWETSMEKDNDYFEIQRSTDAKNFSALGQVKGSASGFKTHHYSYADSEIISPGILYYRLKMVDLDQSFTYSRMQSVQLGQAIEVYVFPNPVSNNLSVGTTNWENVKAVKLYNLNGKAVYNSGISGLSKSIDVKSMGEGAYVVELLFKDGQMKTSRIVITR